MLRRIALGLVLALLAALPAAAQDLQKGVAAYEGGDYATALRELRPLAEKGNAEAQTYLGLMYRYGEGVPKNYVEALKWVRKAVEQDYATAQHTLGSMYYRGRGVPQDYAQAVKWYRKAAVQGLAQAQNNLGAMYEMGRGVPQDHAEAVRWYRKAADQGHADAQNNLGSMYAKSQGVVTKAPPRGPLPRESSSNISTAEVTLPAPEGASAIMPPPLAPKPAKTMIKAPLRTPKTKTKVVKTPPKAKNDSQVQNTPKAIVAALPPAPARAGFRVQLGAVKSKAHAARMAGRWSRIHKAVLGNLRIMLERADLGARGIFYRLRAGPLADRSAAAALCAKLKARKQDCIVIKP